MRMKTALMAAAAGLALHAHAAQAQPADDGGCGALAGLSFPGVEITDARVVAPAPPGTVTLNAFTGDMVQVPLPAYCRVQGMIDRRTGAGGAEYGLAFVLALPDDWNGRFLYQGGGGFNGVLREAVGPEPSGDMALAQGFAVVSTDGGHSGPGVAFLQDQQAALDFAFNAVPTVTRVGQSITAAYYGSAPHHTYAAGCSTGGRESVMAAQRFPLLFDGVAAGAPVMRLWHSQVTAWNAEVAFNRISPADAQGQPLKLEAFSPEDQRLLFSAVAAQCDALDGLEDGMIGNRAACAFDPGILQCAAEKTESCLSPGQVTALRTAFDGPRDSGGNVVASGFPYDLGLLGEHVANSQSLLPGQTPGQFGPPPSPLSLDVDREIARVHDDPMRNLTDTFNWTNLDTFFGRGGRMILYHGAADPWFSVLDTEDYVARARAANPDHDAIRFYEAPSMGHCVEGGTDAFDVLAPLVEWVENGVAPEAILAFSKATPELSRPLCPWPQYAHYDGQGAPSDAASFACRSN